MGILVADASGLLNPENLHNFMVDFRKVCTCTASKTTPRSNRRQRRIRDCGSALAWQTERPVFTAPAQHQFKPIATFVLLRRHADLMDANDVVKKENETCVSLPFAEEAR